LAEKQWPASGGEAINPAFAQMWMQSPNANSYYHGLTASVMRRLTSGLQFQAAYSLSKMIDQGASQAGGDGYPNQRISYYWDMDGRRGRSILDIRNNFVTNLTYNFPQLIQGRIGSFLVNGWQVNGIMTLADGFPFTVTDTNSAQTRAMRQTAGNPVNLIPGGNNDPVLGTPSAGYDRYYDVEQFIPSTCRGGKFCRPGDASYVVGFHGNLGQNTVTGPGVATFDFSLNKSFQVVEEKAIQFRAEFFNLFNRPNFSGPDATPFLSSGNRDNQGGRITSTRGSSREVQFGLKFSF
jgi:hypothetical protein